MSRRRGGATNGCRGGRSEGAKRRAVMGVERGGRRGALVRSLVILLIGLGLGWLGRGWPRSASADASRLATALSTHEVAGAEGTRYPLSPRRVGEFEGLDETAYPWSEGTYARLRAVLSEKKTAILELFADVDRSARRVATDARMLECFRTVHSIFASERGSDDRVWAYLRCVPETLRRGMNRHYALHYSNFYDVLFVSPDRYVFYSFRREPDLTRRVSPASALASGLRRCLEGEPHEVIVDYGYYAPSERVSAFFALPVIGEGEFEGWFVVQYAVNVLDSLLVDHHELGRTGEVYLVNREGRMLTDSRFDGERSHLRYTVEAIDPATVNERGARCGVMADYRGERVFAAYERVVALGQTWVIVAQIDEAEVLTDYCLAHVATCLPRLTEAARDTGLSSSVGSWSRRSPIRVDMDQFARTHDGRGLETRGVSTCTAVAVCYPGRFGYLAHISPYDKVYGATQLTNVLKQMISRIRHYDIRPYEMAQLEVVVVAPHGRSLGGILRKLAKYGITLNQVRFAHDAGAQYANVYVDELGGEVLIEWASEGTAEQRVQRGSGVCDLGRVLRAEGGVR